MRRDCGNKSFDLNILVKFRKTSEASKCFENNILSRLCLCKIIEKLVMVESFVFCPARLNPRSSTQFSIACSRFLILNSHRNRES